MLLVLPSRLLKALVVYYYVTTWMGITRRLQDLHRPLMPAAPTIHLSIVGGVASKAFIDWRTEIFRLHTRNEENTINYSNSLKRLNCVLNLDIW